ncbi:MAG TPA: M20 family metallo-hydrolase [Bryobacteraceae bacterium]|nr:M20 family metallo-hydrolase [Bryobacteraceae bacterium]
MTIDQDRLTSELETLSAFSDAPAPAVTRIVFTDADRRARAYIKDLCGSAGLQVREDAVGNSFARWAGEDETLPAVGTGSHIDAIPHSGRYDGTVGVLGGLEAILSLRRSGFLPRRSIELLMFTSEEPTRFGIGCLGSRLLSGNLSAASARTLKDNDGRTLDEVRMAAGFHGSLEDAKLPHGYYHAFIELHIEQGPLLEQQRIPLGIVSSIAAPASFRIVIEGEGGHAGAVLMPDRHDAFLAAAEVALEVEAAARSTGAIDTVGTVGVCEVFPGAVNSIPSRVVLMLDARDTDEQRRDSILDSIRNHCERVSRERGVTIDWTLINADSPAVSSPMVMEALTNACRTQRVDFQIMVSRAYHDSLFMSRIAPTAMLFVPCAKGYSHRPGEYAAPDDIARGAAVLASALAELAT